MPLSFGAFGPLLEGTVEQDAQSPWRVRGDQRPVAADDDARWRIWPPVPKAHLTRHPSGRTACGSRWGPTAPSARAEYANSPWTSRTAGCRSRPERRSSSTTRRAGYQPHEETGGRAARGSPDRPAPAVASPRRCREGHDAARPCRHPSSTTASGTRRRWTRARPRPTDIEGAAGWMCPPGSGC
jgi:hypothetical protein